MTRFMAFTAIVIGLFAMLLTWIGFRLTPTDPLVALALNPDASCPQPCWHGIRLGTTTVDEAFNNLHADQASFVAIERPKAYSVTWQFKALPEVKASLTHLFGRPAKDVESVRFDLYDRVQRDERQLTLGDAIRLWGTPIGASIYYCNDDYTNRAIMEVHFAGNIQVLTEELFNDQRGESVPMLVHVTPHVRLASVQYYADSNQMVPRPRSWNGFKDRLEASLKYYTWC